MSHVTGPLGVTWSRIKAKFRTAPYMCAGLVHFDVTLNHVTNKEMQLKLLKQYTLKKDEWLDESTNERTKWWTKNERTNERMNEWTSECWMSDWQWVNDLIIIITIIITFIRVSKRSSTVLSLIGDTSKQTSEWNNNWLECGTGHGLIEWKSERVIKWLKRLTWAYRGTISNRTN